MKTPAFWDKHFSEYWWGSWGIQSDLWVYNHVKYEKAICFLTRCFDNSIKVHAPQIKCSEADTSEGCAAVQGDMDSRVLHSESGLSPMNFSTYMEHGINFRKRKLYCWSKVSWYTQTTTILLDSLGKPASYANCVFEHKWLLTSTRGLHPKCYSGLYWTPTFRHLQPKTGYNTYIKNIQRYCCLTTGKLLNHHTKVLLLHGFIKVTLK